MRILSISRKIWGRSANSRIMSWKLLAYLRLFTRKRLANHLSNTFYRISDPLCRKWNQEVSTRSLQPSVSSVMHASTALMMFSVWSSPRQQKSSSKLSNHTQTITVLFNLLLMVWELLQRDHQRVASLCFPKFFRPSMPCSQIRKLVPMKIK